MNLRPPLPHGCSPFAGQPAHLFFCAIPAALCLFLAGFLFSAPDAAHARETAVFVGSENCASCHEEQFNRFKKFSKKATSWERVRKMLPKLTPSEQDGCYSCHTTGFGQPGGFVNIDRTPKLADVGCETCHGAGSIHAESGDPAAIQRKPAIKQCEVCHNAERIRNFNFKPLVYSGAH